MINEFHTQRVINLIKSSKGECVIGGEIYDVKARHIEPTIILNPDRNSDIMQEEIFGPVLPIILYSSFDEVVD